nr:homeodomain-like protein [Tanacetum cinerariifolium]
KTAVNTNVSHMTQWENARLEAEARLVRGSSRIVSNFYQRTMHSGSAPMSLLSVPQPLCFDVLKGRQGITLPRLSNLSWLETLDGQTMPNMNVLESIEPQTLNDMSTEYHMNTFNTFNNPEEEATQHTLEVSDMIYLQDNYFLGEAFTNHLVNDANYCHGHFGEDSINYWSNILDKLGNSSSSFSSVF